ncbi:hypothetical protein, unlikely [Trypanosoma brucei gambiense DAL972]|uniref:Uncharacterized protein n=1 Tax=Trypanosoma brucei gambiense (strain MHOM/CI/86/DAL972) TaxID=679716 RepID=D0A351_TRYB9|nr:hypothetical protein, unlikely [Trypanosoma brucei gambiense DAL972]CBH15695.1 hypothetical protein, unlikely [Trypanosoma brucei gambiense DAL972]|eukprot:XP_011777959.1 hypothetical protein, unlikely [Trypanosoma brucei gambiense DAL972]
MSTRSSHTYGHMHTVGFNLNRKTAKECQPFRQWGILGPLSRSVLSCILVDWDRLITARFTSSGTHTSNRQHIFAHGREYRLYNSPSRLRTTLPSKNRRPSIMFLQ